MPADSFPGLFSPDEATVVEAVGCTWCGAHLGENCSPRDRKMDRAHVARWYDYWNATHPQGEAHPVIEAPWRARQS